MEYERQLEDLAYGLGRRFAEERDRLGDLLSSMKAEIAAQVGPPGEKGERGDSGEPGERGDKGEPGEPAPDPTPEMVKAALDKLREDRLDLDEKLFAAARRFDRLSAAFEERMASLKDGEPGPPGEPGPQGPAGADGVTGEPRGKYDPGESYCKLDRVSFNKSEWIAMRDDPGKLPGDGWMLATQSRAGPPGAAGVGIRKVTTRDYALVLEMTDGPALTIDMRGMFERYDEERGA